MFTVFTHDIFLGLFVILAVSHRYVPLDISSLWQYALMGLVFLLVRTASMSMRKGLTLAVLSWGIFEVGLALLQMTHSIPSNSTRFEVTGSFGNPGPLGGFLGVLCAGLTDYVCRQKRGNRKPTLWVFLCVTLFLGVIVSGSRAGLLAALAGVLVGLFRKLLPWIQQGHKTQAVLRVAMLLFVTCIGCYLLYRLNPSSANGRLFIWYNTLPLIARHPIMGWGSGGWAGRYMHNQAAYFESHPNSLFSVLADDVTSPYNELLHIGADYGLIGLLFFVGIIVAICQRQQPVRFLESAKASLLAFVIFSLFSYPFAVVHMLVLWAFLMAMLESKPIIKVSLPRYIAPALLASFSGVVIYLYGIYRNSLFDFKYYSCFQNNPDIMFMYAQKENLGIGLKQRGELLEKAAFLFPSSDTYCWYGDYLMKQGISSQAKLYYQAAANMVPVKIAPNYKLFKLYLSEGDTVTALSVGRGTLKKSIKVDNTMTLRMLGEMEYILNHQDN